jgi:peptide/nickel transport system ATP-binding protein
VQPTKCRDEVPPLRALDGSSHVVACHWAEQIKAGELKPQEREAVLTMRTVPLPGSEDPPPD